MTRLGVWLHRLVFGIGLLVLLGGLVIGGFFALIVTLFSGCDERIRQEIPSPNGDFTVLNVQRSCGGAIGSVDLRVRLSRTAEPEAEDETLIEAPSRDFEWRAQWVDDKTLAIDYWVEPRHEKWVYIHPPRRDVILILRLYRR